MPQIDIRYKTPQRSFCLVEAQGSLETDSSGGLQGQQKFGEIEHKNGQVLMRVGVHRVPGTLVQLKKPLAILKKRSNEDGSIRYDVEAIVREKFLFKVRPDVVL
ncbi:hypothetical protein IWW55_004962 [Coemansia sp. RSA 2706]|nr:hypothetical protein LPJ63_003029 [Coemansia sp. RSA 2711]KAJ2296911.1 hypothetical protein IWW55_004962 [Coemansia sp. RSA 2706]KAJ2303770.1 hypothetical protein IWW54_005627 [Coemansia sp. RSA 2705]KAJ2310498.1 hypothetical protein IWW52_005394 [Coemansia sp. RSA 2704]KAJ2321489.1 hypothetical protein IWW51_004402 [Coemansia sp. RSA 2702]KAJ2368285.1 hypothetical protein H4S01_001672 [Coemansia sp. RSA 2610]KAJ2387483.1 hypothetical protein H4S02_003347 [Coemansia sp. RSA 2611]KAJ271741